ncbi:MAG: 4'-phosphopantetheinyl transferase superfamily protein [Bacilli bacterium]|nr:4'-phosphopantetheinyl transferase superfamily protein [Bacilli bacterium]
MIQIFIEDISSIDEKTYNEILLSLPRNRMERIRRLKFRHDKYMSALAGKLINDHLKEYKDKIVFNEHGKGYIEGNPLYYSLSHSFNKAMLVLSDKEVGCDIEHIKERDLEIAKRFFDESEYQEIISSINPLETFIKYWTLKEATLKCKGVGLNEPLSSVHISNGSLKDTDFEVVESKLVFDEYYMSIVIRK